MANIFGLTLKNVKEFKDHEGCPAYQGNIYLGKTKIGFYSDSFMCGDPTVEIDSGFSLDLLNKELESRGADIDMIYIDILDLKDKEKTFKKIMKEGNYCGILTIENIYKRYNLWLWKELANSSKEEVLKAFEEYIINTTHELKIFAPEEECKIGIYRSLSDFEVGEPIDITHILR